MVPSTGSGSARAALWRKRNPLRRRAQELLAHAKRRAADRLHPCTLPLEWVVSRLEHGRCELSGEPFCMVFDGSVHPRTPSIDRISSNEGYTERNCRMVCAALNFGINRWGFDAVADIFRAAINRRDLL